MSLLLLVGLGLHLAIPPKEVTSPAPLQTDLECILALQDAVKLAREAWIPKVGALTCSTDLVYRAGSAQLFCLANEMATQEKHESAARAALNKVEEVCK